MAERLPISIAIVCKDSAATIGRTLESVRPWADEIVAVDSGSSDGTIAMLEAAGARVIASEWLGHIRTKQKALEACTRDWVLCLDSDESVEPDLAASIAAAVRGGRGGGAGGGGGGPSGYSMNRRTYYRDRPLRHVWQPEWRLRLVKRGSASWGGHDPHDVLSLHAGHGAAARLAGHLRHDSFPTFTEHLRKQWAHATTMARSLHASGRRGSYVSLIASPPGAFIKQLVLKRGFLDGYAGWLAAASTACAALIKHAALIEMDRGGRDEPRTK